MNILNNEQIAEVEGAFHEDMATWWDNANDCERMSLTNSPKDLTTKLLEAQVRETLKMVGDTLDGWPKRQPKPGETSQVYANGWNHCLRGLRIAIHQLGEEHNGS